MRRLGPWAGLLSVVAAVLGLNTIVLYAVLDGGAAGSQDSLRFSQGPEVATLDPAKITALGDGRIASALFEGLTVTDPKTLRPRPGVASRWEISEDGLIYTFHLRPEAKWSDGSPLTAADFIYSWRRVLDAQTASEYKAMLYPIRGAEAYAKASAAKAAQLPQLGIEALDDHTLQVKLERPTAYFLSLTAFSTYLPVKREVVERPLREKQDRESWIVAGKLVGNGPYLLKEWRYKDRMRLLKNPHYWNAAKVRIETVDVLPMSTDLALIGYEQGLIDLVTAVPTMAAQELARQHRLGQRDDVRLADNLGTYFYRLNCTHKPLDDVRVRQALALALDKRAIIEKVGRLNQPEARSFIPPGLPDYESPKTGERNVEEARRLLAEAGFPGGRNFPKLTLLYNTDEGHRNAAELAMQAWKEALGIEIELRNVEWKVFLADVGNLKYDIARAGWYGDYVDPTTFLEMFTTGNGNNDTGWASDQYDQLLRKAADEKDAAARSRLLQQAEELLLRESPIIPIYFYVNMSLVKPWVQGFQPNLRNEVLFSDLWLEDVEPAGKAGGEP